MESFMRCAPGHVPLGKISVSSAADVSYLTLGKTKKNLPVEAQAKT
jgi:hypothetical protein